jgi:hypothetical protein
VNLIFYISLKVNEWPCGHTMLDILLNSRPYKLYVWKVCGSPYLLSEFHAHEAEIKNVFGCRGR